MPTDQNCEPPTWILTDSSESGWLPGQSRRGRAKKPRAAKGADALSGTFQERLKWGDFSAEFGMLIVRPPNPPNPVVPYEEQEEELRTRRQEARSHAATRIKFAKCCLEALEEGDAGFFAQVASELRKMEDRYNAPNPAEHLRDPEGLAVTHAFQFCLDMNEPPTNGNVRNAMSQKPLKAFLKGFGIDSPLDRKNITRIANRLGIRLAVGKAGRPKKADKN